MIFEAMNHLAKSLNQSLKQAHGAVEDLVIVSKILETDGSVTLHANNKLALFLINLEKDSLPHPNPINHTSAKSLQFETTPPLYLNLYLILAANFSNGNYTQALKYLSDAIMYFQTHSVFDHHSSPDLPDRIEKLILEIENLKTQELSNIWGILGGKYIPSILYKVRMISIGGDQIRSSAPAMATPSPTVSKN